MYAIVAIAHFYGPSVSAPEILDSGFKTAKEAWTALKSKDGAGAARRRRRWLSHNQYNTTYYIIDEDDFVKVIAPVFYRWLEAVDGRVDGPLTLSGFDTLDKAVGILCHCRPKESLRIADTIKKKAVQQLVVGIT